MARAPDMRLTCPRCDAGLVPSWSGLRCPRMSACGKGGYEEIGQLIHRDIIYGSGQAARA